jgi:XRE family transcriptional regulator, aerobic/anaerobic benzoate catabolism transcriptional regulator
VSSSTKLEVLKRMPRSDAGADADGEFLSALGKRVREVRERRGVARKILARDADVSERYLAQLETGDGNISIILLKRIAQALGVPLPDLLGDGDGSVERRLIRKFLEQLPRHRLEDVIFRLMRDFGSEEAARKKRIALIGLRGAGKSTLGNMLAKDQHLAFVELDKEIEHEAGISLSEVFMLYGQSGYRRIERRCLERIIHSHEHAIISVSGGIVSEPETYDLLRSKCFTVWLKAAPEEHMARVAAQGDLRPMQDNEEAMEDLRRILAAREPLYSKADAIVDTSNQAPEESLIKLRQAVNA